MYIFMEGKAIPNAIKFQVTSGKQFYMERTTDRHTCGSNRHLFIVTKHGQKPLRTPAPGIITINM
jgi:hypothetical protein